MGRTDSHDLFDARQALVLLAIPDFNCCNREPIPLEERVDAHGEMLLRDDDRFARRGRNDTAELGERTIADDDVVGPLTQVDAFTSGHEVTPPSRVRMWSVISAKERPLVATRMDANDS